MLKTPDSSYVCIVIIIIIVVVVVVNVTHNREALATTGGAFL